MLSVLNTTVNIALFKVYSVVKIFCITNKKHRSIDFMATLYIHHQDTYCTVGSHLCFSTGNDKLPLGFWKFGNGKIIQYHNLHLITYPCWD